MTPGTTQSTLIATFPPPATSQRWLAWGVTLACVSITVISVLAAPYGYDEWWHLRMGLDWIQLGLSPWTDHYSISFRGGTINHPPVFFQAAYAQLHIWFGERGGHNAFMLAGLLAAIALHLLYLRRLRAPALVLVTTLPLLVCALQLRLNLRPELLSYSFALLALILQQRACRRLDTGAMLPILALLAVWNLYHTPVFGYVIFFGLFIDIALRLLREGRGLRDWAAWAGWGAMLVAAGFLNTSGSHFLVEMMNFSDAWHQYITEYRPARQLLGQPVTYLLFAASGASIFLALRQRRIGDFVVLVILLYSALSMNRMVTPSAVITVAMLGQLLTSYLQDVRGAEPGPALKMFSVFLLTFTVVGLGIAAREAVGLVSNVPHRDVRLPVQSTDRLLQAEEPVRVFALYRAGGFLLHRLGPEGAVYIDGRTGILYPLTHYERYLMALRNPAVFREEAAKYSFTHALLPATDESVRHMSTVGFDLDSAEPLYVLYKKQGGRFARLGDLWANPQCWPALDMDALSREADIARTSLDASTALTPLAELVRTYLTSSDPADAIRAFDARRLQKPNFVRLLAYRALAEAEYELALDQFMRLERLPLKDQLAAIAAQLHLDRSADARRDLEILVTRPGGVTFEEEKDLFILAALMEEIGRSGPLKPAVNQFRASLQNQLRSRKGKVLAWPLNSTDFCNMPDE